MAKKIKALVCNSVWAKLRGLMFRSQIIPLLFVFSQSQKVSLHSWFVFKSFDVFFLDENFCVVEFKKNFRPFSLYFSKNLALYAFECPVGYVKVNLGDKLTFV